MKRKYSGKFLLMSIILAIVSFGLRPLFLKFSFDLLYLNFLSGLFAIPIVYFLIVSISIRQHQWQSALLLVIGVILIHTIIYHGEYDNIFFIRILGMGFSLLLIGITFIKKVENWFLDK